MALRSGVDTPYLIKPRRCLQYERGEHYVVQLLPSCFWQTSSQQPCPSYLGGTFALIFYGPHGRFSTTRPRVIDPIWTPSHGILTAGGLQSASVAMSVLHTGNAVYSTSQFDLGCLESKLTEPCSKLPGPEGIPGIPICGQISVNHPYSVHIKSLPK